MRMREETKAFLGGDMAEIFRFGAETVRDPSRIKKGLGYEDGRGKMARVDAHHNGRVYLTWVESGRQSVCSEYQFCRRFYLYGNGH
jgi:hypothetical protein